MDGKYNTLAGVGGRGEMPGRARSLPPMRPSALRHRTGVVEEKDARLEEDRYQYQPREQAGLQPFFPPPRMCVPGEVHSTVEFPYRNAQRRSDLEKPEVRNRRNSCIELNGPAGDCPTTEVVEMRMVLPKIESVELDYKVRGTDTGIANYPIYDLDLGTEMFAH